MRARTICAQPGCPRPATRDARCDTHRRRVNGHRWAQLVTQVVTRDRGVCWLCGHTGATSADHIRRVRDGGTDALSNLRAAHITCNLRRG